MKKWQNSNVITNDKNKLSRNNNSSSDSEIISVNENDNNNNNKNNKKNEHKLKNENSIRKWFVICLVELWYHIKFRTGLNRPGLLMQHSNHNASYSDLL